MCVHFVPCAVSCIHSASDSGGSRAGLDAGCWSSIPTSSRDANAPGGILGQSNIVSNQRLGRVRELRVFHLPFYGLRVNESVFAICGHPGCQLPYIQECEHELHVFIDEALSGTPVYAILQAMKPSSEIHVIHLRRGSCSVSNSVLIAVALTKCILPTAAISTSTPSRFAKLVWSCSDIFIDGGNNAPRKQTVSRRTSPSANSNQFEVSTRNCLDCLYELGLEALK